MMRSSPYHRPLLVLLLAALALPACRPADADRDAPVADGSPTSPQHAFWANLVQHCGNAYPGRLVLEPPGDDMLTGTEELIVHFRECGQDTLRVPFHIEIEATGGWDRSRTWMFMRTANALELRHDHRHEDGSPDEQTMYGAFTVDEGSPNTQEFIIADRRAQDGSLIGWRVEIEPRARYTYGTIRGGEWTWRVDFDLSRPVTPPPAPWGH
jgi:hypothetical protein